LVNCLGGVLIGTLQHGLPLGEAVQTYVILTIGDGLASQIPTLVLSLAAGLLVTRVTDSDRRALHEQVRTQLLSSPRLLGLLAVCIATFAIVPGVRIPFLG